MTTLILALPLAAVAASPEYDYVLTPDGQQVTSAGRAVASMLPAQPGRPAEVVAVIPARALSWHCISLPERVLRSMLSGRIEPARARVVLAGVMEEQLLDEPDHLHFAVFAAANEAVDAPKAWVAVCDRAWLQAGLQALELAGHTVSRMVAECTPTQGGPAHALLSGDMQPAQLLLCTPQGVSLLPLLPASLTLAQAHGELEVLAEPAVMDLAEKAFGNRATLQTRAQRLLLAAQSPWNLAQLELSASPGGRFLKRLTSAWQQVMHSPQWRPVRWGLVTLMLVHVLALNALAWRQRALLVDQRAAIQGVLKQSFPDVQLVIDAPLQMQRAVDDLARSRGTGSDADLGRVFSIISTAAPAGLSLSSIDLNGKQLRLAAAGLDAATVQNLMSALEVRGLHGQLQDGQLTIAPKESR